MRRLRLARPRSAFWLLLYALAAAPLLAAAAAAAAGAGPAPSHFSYPRYITHVSTDRPVYRPGETVYLRGWVLNALNGTPPWAHGELAGCRLPDDQPEPCTTVAVHGPDGGEVTRLGATVLSPEVPTVGGHWGIPAGAAGGEYTAAVTHSRNGWVAGERRFAVRRFATPRLTTRLRFEREGYVPGEEVAVRVSVTRSVARRHRPVHAVPPLRDQDLNAADPPQQEPQQQQLPSDAPPAAAEDAPPPEPPQTGEAGEKPAQAARPGQPAAGAVVSVTAVVDGVTVQGGRSVADENGEATVRFTLPEAAALSAGEGTATVAAEDGGVLESQAATIPLLWPRFGRLTAYPEGGDLAAGAAGRVYFEAETPTGRPADCRVAVERLSAGGEWEPVAEGATAHEGRGVTAPFTPAEGGRYRLRVVHPTAGGSADGAVAELPPPRHGGVALGAVHPWYAEGTEVVVTLASRETGPVQVELAKRDVVVHSGAAQLDPGGGPVRLGLPLPANVSGALRVTVLRRGSPVAERLVFVRPARALPLEVSVLKKDGLPADRVAPGEVLTARVTADLSEGPAAVGLSVFDSSTLALEEERRLPPSLPAMALLEGEVLALYDPEAYLQGDGRAADLLLGTQGWRRFAFADPLAFLARPEQRDRQGQARRALALQHSPAHYLVERFQGNVLFIRGGDGGIERWLGLEADGLARIGRRTGWAVRRGDCSVVDDGRCVVSSGEGRCKILPPQGPVSVERAECGALLDGARELREVAPGPAALGQDGPLLWAPSSAEECRGKARLRVCSPSRDLGPTPHEAYDWGRWYIESLLDGMVDVIIEPSVHPFNSATPTRWSFRCNTSAANPVGGTLVHPSRALHIGPPRSDELRARWESEGYAGGRRPPTRDAPAVGVDFGTAQVTVAYRGDTNFLDCDADGICTGKKNPQLRFARSPSAVAFDANGSVLVGADALLEARYGSTAPLTGLRQLLGRRYSELTAAARLKVPFPLVEGPDDSVLIEVPAVEANGSTSTRRHSPDDLAVSVLAEALDTAETQFGIAPKGAVITVPPYFGDAQRAAFWRAVQRTGLSVLRIINEPSASIIAYRQRGIEWDGDRILVVDVGASAVHVTLAEWDEGFIEVIGSDGDDLGGADLDDLLAAKLLETSPAAAPGPRGRVLLRQACEAARRQLSFRHQAEVAVPELGLRQTVGRAALEELAQPLLDAVQRSVQRILEEERGDSCSIIDAVILTGDVGQMPLLRSAVERRFPEAEMRRGLAQDSAAAGAALMAGTLSGATEEFQCHLDVTPLSIRYAVGAVGGRATTQVIPRLTAYPTKKSVTVTTEQDHQRTIIVRIYQGEHAVTSRLLGELVINVPPAPKGVPQIEVTFEVDENGIVRATTRDKASGAAGAGVEFADFGGLSAEDIQRMTLEEQFDMDMPEGSEYVEDEDSEGAEAEHRDDESRPGDRNWMREVGDYARIFAFRPPPREHSRPRQFFEHTLAWTAGETLTENRTHLEVKFRAPDSMSSFTILAEGVGALTGRLGAARRALEVSRPFFVDARPPLEVAQGDSLLIPVAVTAVGPAEGTVELAVRSADGLERRPAADVPPVGAPGLTWHTEQAGESARAYVAFGVPEDAPEGARSFTVLANSTGGGGMSDAVTRSVEVRPRGYPADPIALSGQLAGGAVAQLPVELPGDAVPGTLRVGAVLLPSPASTIGEALKSLLRQPYGCFEQTSMTTYPLAMALSYFKAHPSTDPATVQQASALLRTGYKRLVSYETESGGYEWFGQSPGHEALTAYAVMQFNDIKRAIDGLVDDAMLARTTQWLMDRRSGSGGFQRSSAAMDDFGRAPQGVTDAYITWALAAAGLNVKAEVSALLKEAAGAVAAGRADPYVVSMVSGALLHSARGAEARHLLDWLARQQSAAGDVGDADATITMSGGQGRLVETTAVAALAFAQSGRLPAAFKAADWLAEQHRHGDFGSTQATVLALKAITAVDQHRGAAAAACAEGAALTVSDAAGGVLAVLQGRREESAVRFDGTAAAAQLPRGQPRVLTVRLGAGAPEDCRVPFSLTADYARTLPETHPQTELAITTRLGSGETAEGESTEVHISVGNTADRGLPMTVARVGLPGGMEWRDGALREARDSGKVDFYETAGRELRLYWRRLAPRQNVTLRLDALAAVPGRYEGAASSAYLYYTAERKAWAAPLAATITPRAPAPPSSAPPPGRRPGSFGAAATH
eukprot:TRINITY_DN70_c0_g2_i2.p1 TRINITY_DN70_c0_g2~~TRINITY_DN70_c0_g2_i2.p1  ORF type:complete len:2243 (+),score=498.86 TRINITY_DN70_c0_g2_i2:81-6731(+)